MNENIETGIEEIKDTDASAEEAKEDMIDPDEVLTEGDEEDPNADEPVEAADTEDAADNSDVETESEHSDADAVDLSNKNAVDDELTEAEKRRILANPMFLTFAKGKAQSLDELISDFSKMLSLGGEEPIISVKSRATPSPSAASPDYALSERQRRIARDAGMSYREYYGFLKNMKTK